MWRSWLSRENNNFFRNYLVGKIKYYIFKLYIIYYLYDVNKIKDTVDEGEGNGYYHNLPFDYAIGFVRNT